MVQIFTALVGLHDVRSLGLESTLSIASYADVLRLVTRDKHKKKRKKEKKNQEIGFTVTQ